MVIGLYAVTFAASLFTLLVLLLKHDHASNLLILFNILTTVQSFGRILISTAETLELAYIGNIFVYIGGCFCPLVVSFIFSEICNIKVPKWIFAVLTTFAVVMYCFSLTIGFSDLYYVEMHIVHGNGFNYLAKTYGPVHKFYPVMVILFFIFNAFCLVYAIRRRETVSLRTVRPIAFLFAIIIISYLCEKIFKSHVSYLSVGYFLAMLLCFHLLKHTGIFNMRANIVNCTDIINTNGYMQFDEHFRCAGYNDKVLELFPEIATKWKFDEKVPTDDSFLYKEVIQWLLSHKDNDTKTIELNDEYYEIKIHEIPYGKRSIAGYLLEFFNRTAENKYLMSLMNHNKNLTEEVHKKANDLKAINNVGENVIDPAVREYLINNNVPLDGETKNATVLFCNIHSFTEISKNMPVKKVVKMLNIYFTTMGKCISKNNGIISKYIGDTIMAVFGAPAPSENSALDAYNASKDMKRILLQLNKKLKENGYPDISFGIGIHSGPVIAGNIGARDCTEYTFIGNTVNIANKISLLCEKYNTDLLISSSSVNQIENTHAPLHFVDDVLINDKDERIKLFN